MRRSSWPSWRRGEGKGHPPPQHLLLEEPPNVDPLRENGGLCLHGFNLLDPLHYRQHLELEDLRRQLEDNSALAGRALREELDKAREEQERRHQVEQRVNALSFSGLQRLIQSSVCVCVSRPS